MSSTTGSRFAISRSNRIAAPTVMKNSPSSNPLNGAMLLSSSCRYSLLARTTPARKVPERRRQTDDGHEQGDARSRPGAAAEAVNSSRSRARAMVAEHRPREIGAAHHHEQADGATRSDQRALPPRQAARPDSGWRAPPRRRRGPARRSRGPSARAVARSGNQARAWG